VPRESIFGFWDELSYNFYKWISFAMQFIHENNSTI
jgi:hypothetical protein